MRVSISTVLGVVLAASLPLGSALAEDDLEAAEEGTVRVMVPASRDLRQTGAGEKTMGGWTRVELPARGNSSEVLETARQRFGNDVLLEREYHLDSPADEPFFDDQWYLENAGQSGGTPDADIDASLAWSVSTGSGVLIAVIDSGIDASHPELAPSVIPGWDTVDDDADPSPVGSGFDEAHGSLVAGLVAAATNGIGMSGVAPDASILNMRACSGGSCWSLDVAEAVYFAVDAGADIINLSLGSYGTDDPPLEAAISYARSKDVLVVAASGNTGDDVDNLPFGEIVIPAGLGYSNILSVSATDDRDRRPGFSNYGDSVDVFAPGVDLLTTGIFGDDDYAFVSGTSFAAPVVSGLAALLLSNDPGISHEELKARIEVFTDRPSTLSGLSAHGRINAGRTLTTRFADTGSSVFVNAIDWLASQNITEGCNPPYNYLYCPSQRVTRGEMAVFFARAFDLPATSKDYFDDDNGLFYEAAANRMAAAGVTVGCGDRRYCGERDISREEMAAMLARVLGLPSTSSDFFIDDEDSIFENAINKIAAVGVTKGCDPPDFKRFCPNDKVTRGEMSAFIKRADGLTG